MPMTISVRIDAAPTGESDLIETLRMAIGLALGDAPVHVVFTDGGRAWWDAARIRDDAVRRRLDELRDALEAIGATIAGLEGEGVEATQRTFDRLADSGLLINSIGRFVPMSR